MVSFFEFVYVVDYIDGFLYIEPSLHPWDEAYLIMVDDHLMCSWIRLATILLNIFASVFIRGIALTSFFFVWFLCSLGIRVIVDS